MDIYTDDSWKPMEEALQHGQSILDDDDSTQQMVDEAVILLNNALENLELKLMTDCADKRALEALIERALELSGDDYT
ncbi:MAG: hypothetical protein LUB61_02475, partial [Eggerthellaceae bacterium]|nr:hypothetical protein [Eggerthellaceae bacterium]